MVGAGEGFAGAALSAGAGAGVARSAFETGAVVTPGDSLLPSTDPESAAGLQATKLMMQAIDRIFSVLFMINLQKISPAHETVAPSSSVTEM